jgi:glycoprotein endo-alpha-1,2-mannosidase
MRTPRCVSTVATIWTALVVLALAGCIAAQREVPTPTSLGVPHEVLAFYYGWYGNPKASGRWHHWEVAPDQQHAVNITHTPLDGLYDSHDPVEVEREVQEAREAGVTGFIASWWGQHSFEDASIPPLLAAAQRSGLKVTAYLEKLTGDDDATRANHAVDDLLYLVRTYGENLAWLRVGNRPVVFIYGRASKALSPPAWAEVLARVRSKAEHGIVVIGPFYNDKARIATFDGMHEYNITGAIHSLALPEMAAWARAHYGEQVGLAKSAGKISCVTVIPGYDDSTAQRPLPRPITRRDAGRPYAALWQAAIAAQPDWVLITSWNEWHEGSEIEPSQEYKSDYLRQTKPFATEFLSLASRSRRAISS